MSVATVNPSPQLEQAPALRAISIVGVLLFVIGALLPLLVSGHVWPAGLRWAGLLVIALTGLWRQSLTRWILFAMLVGGEIGLDRPQFAEHLRVLSEIFLRLIKVIVAPLIFGTLVTGISGHGNLRSVGRIGVKSLIYFEVVTTLALFLGIGAINLSRAGEGLAISQTATVASPQNPAPLRWDDFLLHIFPENIAKSVAENQVLQVAVFAILFGIALARLPEAKRTPMLKFCESLADTMFSFTTW
jgi:proton glutamate symport protein